MKVRLVLEGETARELWVEEERFWKKNDRISSYLLDRSAAEWMEPFQRGQSVWRGLVDELSAFLNTQKLELYIVGPETICEAIALSVRDQAVAGGYEEIAVFPVQAEYREAQRLTEVLEQLYEEWAGRKPPRTLARLRKMAVKPKFHICYDRKNLAEFLGCPDWFQDSAELRLALVWSPSEVEQVLRDAAPVDETHPLWVCFVDPDETRRRQRQQEVRKHAGLTVFGVGNGEEFEVAVHGSVRDSLESCLQAGALLELERMMETLAFTEDRKAVQEAIQKLVDGSII